jgi:hypothetical protein
MPAPAFGPVLGRRDLLRFGAVGAASALPPRGLPASPERPGTARSVVVLWMAGGVTHLDSFDPKPDAPAEVRGSLRPIPTALPGVRFTEVMPELARAMGHLALVRTFAPGTDDHFIGQARALSGRRAGPAQITTEPNVGAVVARLRGPRAGFPGYVAVPGTTRPGPPPKNLFVGGWLGEQYAPFPTGGRAKNEDFTAHVSEGPEDEFTRRGLSLADGLDDARLADRRGLREAFDARLRQLERPVGEHFRGAFSMLQSPAVRAALDIGSEPDRVRERYGRTKIGARCLLARRLVEAGAGFVMVDYGYDPDYGNLWDNHNAPGQNFPPIVEMAARPYHLAGTDRAAAALVEDLHARGLLGQTLVVFLTEFGRTPRINPNAGRDHWGNAGSIFFAGGGTRGGRVIGATDRTAAYCTTPAYGPWDVAATVYAALGVDPETLLTDREGRPIPLLSEGTPIPGVLG